MLLDSGILIIYAMQNVSEPGDMPMDKLVEKSKHWFGDRIVGINRFFAAKQVDNDIERVVRIWQDRNILVKDCCVCDDIQYKILQVQHLLDEDGLRVTDLTLERIGDLYAIE